MKTIVLAYHNMGCEGIRALLRNGYDITAIFTHSDDARENIWFESVARLGAEYNISVHAPEDINHPLWVKRIRGLSPEILFSFYYRDLIGKEILSIPRMGSLNLHGSLLPKYRGRCPVNWVLVNGEKETGATLHFMTPQPDDGDIVAQARVAIKDQDTAVTLNGKLCNISAEMLDEILPKIKKGKIPRTPQVHAESTYYGGRRPEDGEIDWSLPADKIRNLVRAVTMPYPGAFSFIGDRKCFFWQVTAEPVEENESSPGTILSTNPLKIQCGSGHIQVDFCEFEGGIYMSGSQMALEMKLNVGMRFVMNQCAVNESCRKKHVLILGVGGFIGNALSDRLLASRKYVVHGMDLNSDGIQRLLGHPDFHFHEGDIAIHREWIEYHVKKCDIVLPLVAIATPAEYNRNPIKVFELDFEENLRIVRYCVKNNKRLIFPSTSEVYGMCGEDEFNEETSRLVLGPINKQRWIYSCSKQLLDRVIWAYGQKEGLQFTLFRPFNWIGPRLDSLSSARIGSSRAITQLILNLVEGTPIQLVDGGEQKRCFTDVADGVECLYRIIEDKDSNCNGQIINIGNPDNEASIRELAEIIIDKFLAHDLRDHFPPFAGINEIESQKFYGPGYEDVQFRKPSIRNAYRLLKWQPAIGLAQSVAETLDFFLAGEVKAIEKQTESANFQFEIDIKEAVNECRVAN